MWLNAKAFAAPAAGTYGTAGRNGFRGTNLWQMDFAVAKRFPFTEKVGIDFRAEAFNLLNRAQYGEPVSNFSDSTFGRILVTANDGATGTGTSRQLQMVLRLTF